MELPCPRTSLDLLAYNARNTRQNRLMLNLNGPVFPLSQIALIAAIRFAEDLVPEHGFWVHLKLSYASAGIRESLDGALGAVKANKISESPFQRDAPWSTG
jgi:hypothetical protein